MSVESIEVNTTSLNLDVQSPVPQTLQIVTGAELDVILQGVGLQGGTGPAGANGTNGVDGADGRGIVSVIRTSGTGAPGTTDTYTITYTDATTSTFQVYNGANGSGSGDMLKSTYDTDNDGVVDAAEAVPWTGVTGKPSSFPSTIADVTGLQTALDSKQDDITANGILKGDGAGNITSVVSGTDIKTINGSSILGSGDIILGDVVGPASSSDSGIVLYDGLTGKLLKTTTLNGILRGSAGVMTTATAGVHYVAPSGALGTPSSGTLTNCTADGTNPVGFKNIPQNSQNAAYELVLTDAGKHILHPSADTTARTFTIPANSSVAYPIGTAITFINQNAAGTVTIAITTDTMRLSPAGTTGSRTLAPNGIATAVKITSTEWIISGTGLT